MSLESCSVFLAFGKCCHSHQNVELRLAGAAMVYGAVTGLCRFGRNSLTDYLLRGCASLEGIGGRGN